jgi:hypothetical protein
MPSKINIAQDILNQLSNDKLNIDFRIDEREVFLKMDEVVNNMARKSFLENWQLSSAYLDELFISTWDGDNAIDVVDAEDQPSHLVLPAHWVDLPRNAGIQEIYPLERGEYMQSVVIISHGDLRMYQNNPAGNMQGRLFGYPKGNLFIFGEENVGGKFGEKFGVRLAVRDSSFIAANAPYPVPSDKLLELKTRLVIWFRERLAIGSDKVRDSNTVNTG